MNRDGEVRGLGALAEDDTSLPPFGVAANSPGDRYGDLIAAFKRALCEGVDFCFFWLRAAAEAERAEESGGTVNAAPRPSSSLATLTLA